MSTVNEHVYQQFKAVKHLISYEVCLCILSFSYVDQLGKNDNYLDDENFVKFSHWSLLFFYENNVVKLELTGVPIRTRPKFHFKNVFKPLTIIQQTIKIKNDVSLVKFNKELFNAGAMFFIGPLAITMHDLMLLKKCHPMGGKRYNPVCFNCQDWVLMMLKSIIMHMISLGSNNAYIGNLIDRTKEISKLRLALGIKNQREKIIQGIKNGSGGVLSKVIQHVAKKDINEQYNQYYHDKGIHYSSSSDNNNSSGSDNNTTVNNHDNKNVSKSEPQLHHADVQAMLFDDLENRKHAYKLRRVKTRQSREKRRKKEEQKKENNNNTKNDNNQCELKPSSSSMND